MKVFGNALSTTIPGIVSLGDIIHGLTWKKLIDPADKEAIEARMKAKTRTCPICGEDVAPSISEVFSAIFIMPNRCQCEVDQYLEEERVDAFHRHQAAIEEYFPFQKDISEEYSAMKFDNFDQEQGTKAALIKAWTMAQKFHVFVKEGKGLFFHGMSGSGKTHLAVAITHSLLSQGKAVAFCEWSTWQTEVKKTWNRRSKVDESYLLNLLIGSDLCVLDDVGVLRKDKWGEFPVTLSPDEERSLFMIVNKRILKHRPTIITSNLTDLEFEMAVGKRIHDRVTGKSLVEHLKRDKSYRQGGQG